MVVGLDRFREFFQDRRDQYVLIGGVAAMHHLEAAGFTPRATKDLDIVVLIERLDAEFLNRFWEFIRAGDYQNLQKGEKRVYYRFDKPRQKDYPSMLEIFSRAHDEIDLWKDQCIVPIPASEDASNLSAILMDDIYYALVRDHTRDDAGLSLLSPEGLILLKAKAWLDLTVRKAEGKVIRDSDITKHRNDIFKLSLLLTPDQPVNIGRQIHHDFQNFLDRFPEDHPEWQGIKQSFAAMGLPMPSGLVPILRQYFHAVQ